MRDKITRAPVPGVSLETTGPATLSSISSAKGEFRFDHLPTGVYKLKYLIQGYLGSDARGAAIVNITRPDQTANLSLDVTPFARLEGVVLDEEGRPLPGVRVYTGPNYQDTTADDGRYAIEPLEPGSYTISLRLPLELRRTTLKRDPDSGETFGYPHVVFYPGIADGRAATPVIVSGGLDLRGFDIRLRRVRLVEFSGHAPGAARIELSPPNDDTNESRPADPDGAFHFDLIQPGAYSLQLFRSMNRDALPYIVPVEVPKSGLHDRTISLPPFASLQGSIAAPPETEWSGQLIFRVLSSPPGAGRQFTVNSEKFTIDDLPPGRWTFQIDANILRQPQAAKLFLASARFGTQDALSEPLVIAESGNPPLEIRLTPESGRISGVVVDEHGLPRKNVIVFATRTGAAFLTTATTGETGAFLIDALAPGAYRLIVLGRDSASTTPADPLTVEVKSGAPTVVRLKSN